MGARIPTGLATLFLFTFAILVVLGAACLFL